MTDINLFLVDDHKLFLTGVETELSEQFPIVGTAGDVDDAIAGIRKLEPTVVLVDVHMPGGGGVTVINNVLETHPDTRFLALSVSDSPEDVIAMIAPGPAATSLSRSHQRNSQTR
jgi:DNA-binding NarL/FixJ family response regulator